LGNGHGLGASEVEPHPVRSDERSSLIGFGLQDLPEGEVEDVGAGVVLHDTLPAFLVNLEKDENQMDLSLDKKTNIQFLFS